MRKLVAGITVAISLASSAVALTSSAAAAPRQFYGVIPADDPTAAELARLGAGRLGTLRINFVWGAVQPGPPFLFYDWSRYDGIIGLAAQNGIRVLPTIYSSPPWVTSPPNYPPPPSFRDEFAAFVRGAAARYGRNGTFWALNPQIPKLPITHWQLWNEVNSPSFWWPKPKPKQYVPLLRVTRRAIKSADRGAKIMLAGLFRAPRVKNAMTSKRYLTGLYRRKARRLFDAVAVHPYARTPRIALQSLKETREIMRRFKDGKKPLWITEVGWATGGRRTHLTVTLSRQAAYLRRTFKLTAANRKRLRIAGVVWYSFKDTPVSDLWFNYTGLFGQDGSPKPSWYAFVGRTGGTP